MRIVALSGSLQQHSSNTALLGVARSLAPEGATVVISGAVGQVPAFNPDLDHPPGPTAVAGFRREIQMADAVLIASPEYAYGVPGALKNALDWLVGSGELYGKPVAIVAGSPRAEGAVRVRGDLERTLRAQGAVIVCSVTIPVPRRDGRPDVGLAPDVPPAMAQVLRAIEQHVVASRGSDGPSGPGAGTERVVRIRDATAGEAGALEDLQRRSSLVWEEQRAQLLAHPDAISLPVSMIRDATVRVAHDVNRVVGFSVTLATVGDGPAELDGLFVEPDLMRGGIGRALIADVVAGAEQRGVTAIEVTANPRAVDFYRRVGFRGGEPVSTRFGPGLRMRREIDSPGPVSG